MNKKLNTLLFILGATVVNLVIMMVLLLAGLSLISLLFRNSESGVGVQLSLFLVFAVGIGGTFVIYNQVIKLVSRKVDLDKYFHPIIKPRKRS